MKSIRLKFKTDAGKDFSFSMNYADPALLEEGGDAAVQAAADTIIAQQPFSSVLASFAGAELIDRTVVDILS